MIFARRKFSYTSRFSFLFEMNMLKITRQNYQNSRYLIKRWDRQNKFPYVKESDKTRSFNVYSTYIYQSASHCCSEQQF